MKKFNFNLESVLNYRQLKEDEEQQKLASANFTATQKKERLNLLRTELAEEQQLTGQKISPRSQAAMPIDLLEAMHRELYLDNLQQSIIEQQQQVSLAQAEVHRCKRKVLKAHRDTQVLHNLKAKKLDEYMAEINGREQQLMDELGLSGFLRKAAEQ